MDVKYMGSYFFFFKQKTAYEMRISDWSSDVCSSYLIRMCSTFSTSTANWITDMQFRSVCTITLAMLRWTNTSPGARPMTWLAGTRESEQPIHRYLGACSSDRRSQNCGSSLRTPSDQAWLLRSSFSSACFMESVLWVGELPSDRKGISLKSSH